MIKILLRTTIEKLFGFSYLKQLYKKNYSDPELVNNFWKKTLEILKEIKERYRAFSLLLKQKEPQKKEGKKNDIHKEKIEELSESLSGIKCSTTSS